MQDHHIGPVAGYCARILYAESILNNPSERLELTELWIKQSEINEGQFVNTDLSEAGFTRFSKDNITVSKDNKELMYTFRTRFYLEKASGIRIFHSISAQQCFRGMLM